MLVRVHESEQHEATQPGKQRAPCATNASRCCLAPIVLQLRLHAISELVAIAVSGGVLPMLQVSTQRLHHHGHPSAVATAEAVVHATAAVGQLGQRRADERKTMA